MDPHAENYQLKWNSFGSYLHGCVASALYNDHFTDVSLVTMDGRQIQAHRFILSACSQYLNQVLKMQTKTFHVSPLSIILPPEINYKTLKVLVQYMYCGETTVSQEILESVLRGGDLLKIKGLWRPRDEDGHGSERSDKSDRSSERKSSANHTTKPPQQQAHSNSTNKHSNNRSCTSTPVNVNSSSNVLQRNTPTPLNNSVIKEPRTLQERNEKILQVPPPKRQKNEESVIKTTQQTPPPLAPIQLRHKQVERAESTKDKQSVKEKGKAKDPPEKEINAKDLMQILVIKEEPIEWSEVNQDEIELVEREEIFHSELIIKPEVHMDDADENPEELYSPLTCELCSETFTVPADWVKHVQTHTDMMPAKRQKRGRPSNDDDDSNFPPLQCDMCQEYFYTPAKWVQHIQSAHTEQEMQDVNKSLRNRRSMQRSSSSQILKNTGQPKICSVCDKKFPSHASMIIHKRTHTGERPYNCDYCCKGFNVKSNLLRHLRTLHDKYVNPTDVESKEGDDSDS